ncbi:MAG: transcription antitermination factor NusB [Acidobacteria bacterium]|nr:transcription antitermination factor NusB [Acidobacteriota bacterium]
MNIVRRRGRSNKADTPDEPTRRQSREAALQLLYQSEIGKIPIDVAIETFDRLEFIPSQREFSTWLARGTAAHLKDIDPLIKRSAQHWRLARMAVIDRLIMRIAVFEFLYAHDTPRTVVINEAIELARTFSGNEALPFVNGVLDDIKRRLEAGEEVPVG